MLWTPWPFSLYEATKWQFISAPHVTHCNIAPSQNRNQLKTKHKTTLSNREREGEILHTARMFSSELMISNSVYFSCCRQVFQRCLAFRKSSPPHYTSLWKCVWVVEEVKTNEIPLSLSNWRRTNFITCVSRTFCLLSVFQSLIRPNQHQPRLRSSALPKSWGPL